jgi:hypothetical protein
MQQLRDLESGADRGSLTRLHRESYRDRGYTGPFENTANFLVGAVGSAATSLALYFGVSHALRIGYASIEQRGTENIINEFLTSPNSTRQRALRILPESVSEFLQGLQGQYSQGSGVTQQDFIQNKLKNLIKERIEVGVTPDLPSPKKTLMAEIDAAVRKGINAGHVDLELEKFVGAQIGYDETQKKWSMKNLARSGVGASSSEFVSLFRNAESALFDTTVIPVLRKFMMLDTPLPETASEEMKVRRAKAEEVVSELRDLVRSHITLSFDATQDLVQNLGISRSMLSAELWDKIADLIPANLAAADADFAQAIRAPAETATHTTNSRGVSTQIKGSSISVKALFGTSFVDIIRLTASVASGFGDAVGGRYNVKETLQAIRHNFYAGQNPQLPPGASPLKTRATIFSIRTTLPATGDFAAVRKGLFVAGSMLILDRVFDAYFAKPQGVGLTTQILTEMMGAANRDTERIGQFEYTGNVDNLSKGLAIAAGGLIGGHLYGADAPVGKKFSRKFAVMGALVGLMGVQAGYSATAAYLNMIFGRNKNDGLDLSPYSAVAVGNIGAVVRKAREQDPTGAKKSAAQLAYERTLMVAATDLTRSKIDNTRVTYNYAVQLPNPIFQLTFVARRDPSTQLTSYGGGFQFMPILGAGAVPTAPFGVLAGRAVHDKTIERQLAKRMVRRAVGGEQGQGTFNTAEALLTSFAVTDNTNLLQYIPESQMMGAFATIGALSYVGTAGSHFRGFASQAVLSRAPVSRGNDQQAMRAFYSLVAFSGYMAERAIRLSQVPTLLMPEMAKTFLGNFTNTNLTPQADAVKPFGRALRTLSPYLLSWVAFSGLTSATSQFGGAATLQMLKSAAAVDNDLNSDQSAQINQATLQRLYTPTAAAVYYATAFQRAGVFRSAAETAAAIQSQRFINESDLTGLYGSNRIRTQIGFVNDTQTMAYLQQTGESTDFSLEARGKHQMPLVYSMGLRSKLAARKMLKYSAIAMLGSFVASSAGLLKHDGGAMSFLLDPLRLAGFDNLNDEEAELLASAGYRPTPTAQGGPLGLLQSLGGLFVNSLMGIFNVGKLSGSYQDNPGMFVGLGGPFGFSESTYGPKPYVQATTTFMDISNSQINIHRMFGEAGDAEVFLANLNAQGISSDPADLYYALIGAKARKTPSTQRGGVRSSELEAIRGSSGLARALSVKQAELTRLSHQRPQELYYQQIFERYKAVAAANKRGDRRALLPGGNIGYSVTAGTLGYRDQSALSKFLSFFSSNRGLSDRDSIDQPELPKQSAGQIPFIGTFYTSLSETADIANQGSSKLRFIDTALGLSLGIASAAMLYSIGTTSIAAISLTNINYDNLQRNVKTENILKGYQFSHKPQEVQGRPGFTSGSTSITKAKVLKGDLQFPNDVNTLADNVKNTRKSLANVIPTQAYTHDSLLKEVKDQYKLIAGFYGMSADDMEEYIQDMSDQLRSEFDTYNSDRSEHLSRRRLLYAEFLQRIDTGLTNNQFEVTTTDPIRRSFPRTPVARTTKEYAPTAFGQVVDEIGVTGLLGRSVSGFGKTLFYGAAAADLYTIGSSLTLAGDTNKGVRDAASYHTANTFVELGTGYLAAPVVRAAITNLPISTLIAVLGLGAYLVDKNTGGHGVKALSRTADTINKNAYLPTIRFGGSVISGVTSVPLVGGALTVLGTPFRAADPYFNQLYMKSQENIATALIGMFLLPKPLESFLNTQAGLLPEQVSYFGQRPEKYTIAEIQADREARYQRAIRAANAVKTSLSPDLVSPHIYGGQADNHNMIAHRVHSNSAGYAERVFESGPNSGMSNTLRLALLRRQSNVNHTIAVAYRSPEENLQDMFGGSYAFQAIKGLFWQYGANSKSVNRGLISVAERLSSILVRVFDALDKIDPMVENSWTNRAVNAVGRIPSDIALNIKNSIRSRNTRAARTSRFRRGISTVVTNMRSRIQPRLGSALARSGNYLGRANAGVFLGTGAGFLAKAITESTLQIALRMDGRKSEQIGNIVGFSTFGVTWLGGPAIFKGIYGTAAESAQNTGLARALSTTYRGTKAAVKYAPFLGLGFILGTAAVALGSNYAEYLKLGSLNEKQYQDAITVGTISGGAITTGLYARLARRGQVFKGLLSDLKGLGSKFGKLVNTWPKRVALASVLGVVFAPTVKGVFTSILGAISKPVETAIAVRDAALGNAPVLSAIAAGGLAAYGINNVDKLQIDQNTRAGRYLSRALGLGARLQSAVARRLTSTAGAAREAFTRLSPYLQKGLVGLMPAGSVLLEGTSLFKINKNSNSRTIQNAYKGLEKAFVAGTIMALSRGAIRTQMQNVQMGDLILDSFETGHAALFEKDFRKRNEAAGETVGAAVVAVGGLSAIAVTASRGGPGFVKNLIRKAGGSVLSTALTALSIGGNFHSARNYIHQGATRTSASRRIAEGMADHLATAAGSLSAASLTFGPWGLAVALTGFAASAAFQTDAFKGYLSRTYDRRLAEAGIDTRKEQRQLYNSALTGSTIGASIGAVGTVLGAIGLTVAGVIAAPAVAVVAGVALAATAIGAAIGFAGGVDSYINSKMPSTREGSQRRNIRGESSRSTPAGVNRTVAGGSSLFERISNFLMPPAKAQSMAEMEELVAAEKARQRAVLGTMVRQRGGSEPLPADPVSGETRTEDERPWWQRLWDGATDLARGAVRTVRRGLNRARGAAKNFVDGLTNFFMGSYDDSMIALAAISSLESGHAQGRANVAQSILNRQYAAINYGLNYGQKSNDIASLIIADGQYQPVRDGGARGKAAWAKAAKTGSVEDYVTAISLAPSVGGDRQRARQMLFSSLKQISDPRLQREAQRQVGPRIDFESVASHAANKRGGISKTTDAYGHVFGFMMGSGGINYGRTARTVAPFPVREGGLFQSFGGDQRVRFTRQSDGPYRRDYIHIDLRPNRQPLKGRQTAAESQLVQAMALSYVQAAFRQGETQIEVYSPKTKGSVILTPRMSVETIRDRLKSAAMGHWNSSYAIDLNLLNLKTFIAPDMGKITGGTGGGESGFYTTSSGVAAVHGRNLVSAPAPTAPRVVTKPAVPKPKLGPAINKNYGGKDDDLQSYVPRPQGDLALNDSPAPETPSDMAQTAIQVASALPYEEQEAMFNGVAAIMQKVNSELTRVQRQIMRQPVAISPGEHYKTKDNINVASDPFVPKTPAPTVPVVVNAQRTEGSRIIEIETAVPVAVYQVKISNGNIPTSNNYESSHEPLPLGDHGGNTNTPYGVSMSIGTFG